MTLVTRHFEEKKSPLHHVAIVRCLLMSCLTNLGTRGKVLLWACICYGYVMDTQPLSLDRFQQFRPSRNTIEIGETEPYNEPGMESQ